MEAKSYFGVPLSDEFCNDLEIKVKEIISKVFFSKLFDGEQAKYVLDKLNKLTIDQINALHLNLSNDSMNEPVEVSDKEFFISKVAAWNDYFPLTNDEILKISQQMCIAKEELFEALSLPLAPKNILNYLQKNVKGQDSLLKDLSLMAYIFLLKSGGIPSKKNIDSNLLPMSNFLIIGPTGSGKTYSVKTVAKYLNMNYCYIDSSLFVNSGIVGTSVEDKLTELFLLAGSQELFENSILHFDEIDKKCGYSRGKDFSSYTTSVQSQLLGLMDKDTITFAKSHGPYSEMVTVSTKRMWFIFSGAFSGIEDIISERLKTGNHKPIGFSSSIEKFDVLGEGNLLKEVTSKDLVKYGLLPEFTGRIGRIGVLDHLQASDIKNIILGSEGSCIKEYENFFGIHGISLEFEETAIELIAENIASSALGARNIPFIFNQLLYPKMFEIDAYTDSKIFIHYDEVKKLFT
ncbi:MAG: AAA family ATPase [Bacteroidetes bacterium]|nr:AAA family ATPase [Bacteroidota bacterium]